MEELPTTIAVMEDASANTNGNDTMPSNNQNADDGHRRNISNISEIGPASLSRGISSETRQTLAEKARLRMEHNRKQESETSKITLDGLLQHSEYEHEATTHILRTLEGQFSASQAFDTSVLEGLSDEASKALEDSSSFAEELKPSTSHSSSRRTDDQDRKPLLRSKSRRHQREMSVDFQLATLADMFVEHGFAPDQTLEIAPHSEFDRNAQLAFGTHPFPSGKSNDTTRQRLLSGEQHTLDPVKEGNSTASVDEDKNSGRDGVVDIEAPEASHNTSQTKSKKSSRDSSQRTESDSSRDSSSPVFGSATLSDMTEKVQSDVAAWNFFFRPQRATIKKYIKLLLYIVLPLIGVAALLFYFLDNPTAHNSSASVSWILLFVVRLWVTLTLALAIQAVIIDVMCVGTRFIPRLLGPLLTLWLIQSKGWPFVIFFWSILNFAMLNGTSAFAAHWGFWQDTVSLFSETNPSGSLIYSDMYRIILTIGATVPVAVSVKRLAVGLFLGRQSFLHFGESLARVMDKMLLVSQVAKLGMRMEKTKALMQRRHTSLEFPGQHKGNGMAAAYQDMVDQNDEESSTTNSNVIGLVDSEKHKLSQMLDRWEEPERRSTAHKKASIGAVLRFRNALALIHNDYPFSFAFGLADKRDACVESAQKVFRQLLAEGETDVEFETIAASLAVREGNTLDPDRVKSLIRIFRPNRDGTLSMIDFIKSVDAVYKDFRLLQASIENSAQIDRAFETMFDVIFYVVVVVIIMSQLGLDPMAMFLSLSSVVLAFAFVIGSASSKYFEGILFILLRRPYNIGDLINASHIESETGLMGSIGWIVQNVTLYETTMTWLPTLETATVANGALASSRIVNWARSPNARFVIFLYFPIETKYETLTLFRGAIEEYMKARPREWLAFNALRVLDVFTDKGYMRVELVVQHREAWQNPGAIYDSRGNLVSFCNEVQKLLGMQYKRPPVPIDIRAGSALESLDAMTLAGRGSSITSSAIPQPNGGGGPEQPTREQFRQAAENNHKMFF